MDNGCICCTLREDLLVELYELAQEGKFDYCVIESTGIGEPMQVAETFTFDVAFEIEDEEESKKKGQKKKKQKEEKQTFTLSDFAQLDTCVTVVDAKSFLADLHSVETLADRYGKTEGGNEEERNIANLLIDQIEFSNVILINKTDLVTSEELSKIKGLILKLNPDAITYDTQNASIPLKHVLNTGLFDFEKAACNPGWLKEIRGSHNPETLEYGISSFVYRRRKPFNTKQLHDFFYNEKYLTNNGVLRSKGYVWLCTRDDYCGDWEQAGHQVTIHDGGKFFAAIDEDQCKEMYGCDILEKVRKDFVEKIGDRRQELVFIGQNLNREEVEKRLDAMIISDQDFEKGPEHYGQLCQDDFTPFNSFEMEEDWQTDDEDMDISTQ